MTDTSDLKRIRKREERGESGPWKWQLIEILEQVREGVRDLNAKMEKMHSVADTHRKLSEAGKKSAAARKAKFGSARPPKNSQIIPIRAVQSIPFAEAEISIPQNGDLFSEHLHEPVRKKNARKPKPPTDGSVVWDRYQACYRKRWRTDPLRSAQSNRHCCQLVALVGKGRAEALVEYYVSRHDAFFTNAKHPLGLCLSNAQKLVTEMQTDTVVTMTDARRSEAHSQTERAIRQYAATQNAEGVREPVHEVEANET